jgi:hypothetical protein
MVVVRSETVRRTRNTIKGYFNLTDGSKTQFSIDKEYGWQQWGNTMGNLGETVDRLEQLQRELLEQ